MIMAAIPPVTAASSPGGGDDVSIRMPAPAATTAGGAVLLQPTREADGGAPANSKPPENHLSRFVHCVAFGEWAGNAFGALAFVWATGVLLGGFCSSLNRQDFWVATIMIFIESFRIFSHRYKLDGQSLFGSTRALRWRNSYFIRMLGRPQEGNEVVLVVCLWLNLIAVLCFDIIHKLEIGIILWVVLAMAVFVTWSWRPRRPKRWQKQALAIAYVLGISRDIVRGLLHLKAPQVLSYLVYILPDIIVAVPLLMLNLRPRRIASLTSTPCGRKLISLAKLTSALCLAIFGLLIMLADTETHFYNTILPILENLVQPFTLLVLSLRSLQNHQGSLFGRCTDAIMHISLIFYFVVLLSMILAYDSVPGLSTLSCAGLSLVLLLVLLLSGNLQIPAAVVQVVLSSLRLIDLLVAHTDYNHLPSGSSNNMVAAIAVFYVLALCQGSLYIMASFLGLLSCFPRRWLMRRSKFGGDLGAKAIDLYYDRAYATRMEMGLFGAARGTMTLADFAIESLSSSSSSRDLQVAGLCVLHNMLQERSTQDQLILRVTSSSGIAVSSTLIDMLAWTADMEEDGYAIRLLAARVTAELASSLRISSIPGMLKPVSSLLKLAENTDAVVVVVVPNELQGPGHHQQTPLAIANGGSSTSNGRWRSWVCQFWQRMKQEYWSVPEEPATLLTHQHSSLPVLGMVILEKLARDLDNCGEIFKDDKVNLISKTIGIIGLATSDNEQDDALVCSSLEFLRRLATTGERIGAALRQELWNQPFLLTCLARVLEDDDRSPQVWEPAMDIIAKLAMESAAGLEIGRNQVITARLLHVFLGRHGPTNMYYDQSLRKVSGEALANLALWGTGNCSTILEEPGYEVVNDLTSMLSDDDYRYDAATLLLNLCAHCSVNLLSYPHASEHLSSALTTVMEHIMVAEGKLLESLINLASAIGDVICEAFARELESQTNSGTKLVQKLLCTLNLKKIPNPQHPRMRRVIVKILISILESCHRTIEKLMEEGMVEQLIESLTKIQRSPSRVEEYKVFYGNIGVVLEDGEPMSILVARAKALLVCRTTQTTVELRQAIIYDSSSLVNQ